MQVRTDQLPFLLTLLEDSSPVVRDQVKRALAGFGPFLRPATLGWVQAQGEEVKEVWEHICCKAEEQALEQSWLSWMLLDSPASQLEAGMMALEFGGSISKVFIREALDDLADDFLRLFPNGQTHDLMDFLFRVKGFEHTLREETYLHHRLGYVLRYGSGSQLGLAIMAVVVGSLVDLPLSLVKLQGNWLVLEQSGQEKILYNPEHRGARLLRSEQMCVEEAYRRGLLSPENLEATPEEIMLEVLEAHLEGYKRSGLRQREEEMMEKRQDLAREIDRRHLAGYLSE